MFSVTVSDGPFFCSPQYVEAISNKQSELDNYIAEGYKHALSEERRRYCFLVDRQCAVAKNSSVYHSKVSGATGPDRTGGGGRQNVCERVSAM